MRANKIIGLFLMALTVCISSVMGQFNVFYLENTNLYINQSKAIK
jgi:hypothetical protein